MTSDNEPFASVTSKATNNNQNLGNSENQRRQWLGFALFLLAYFIIWSVAPIFLASSVPFDVGEGINWGHEWQWGYYKHPPLSSWVLYSFYKIFGHIGPYLLSQLCVVITLALVYKLGKQIWSASTALLGSMLTLAVVYYTYPSLEFNHNVAQFPIWAGLYLAFYQALTRNRVKDWLLLGVLGGLGMVTKYSVIFLLIPMSVYLLLPKQWPLLKQPQPWIAALTMLALFAPHFYWLMLNDWLPLTYANGRSHDVGETANDIARHFSWLSFITAQFLVHIPLLLMLVFNRKRLFGVREYKQHLPAGASLLWYLWLAPIVLLIILSLIFGIGLRDMWGMPMWALSGLLAASFILPSRQALMTTKLRKALVFWLTLVTLLMIVYISFGDKIRHKPSRMQWPEQALALQAQDTWQSVSNCALDSVSGDRWLGSLVAMNNGFPSQMISGLASHSPWMNAARLQQYGTLVIWEEGKDVVLPLLNEVLQKQGIATPLDSTLIKKEGQWQLAWREDSIAQPLMVNWVAYVPKHCIK